VTAENLIEQS
jgi:multiple RNA-binding domain-containing protein 1